MNEKLPWSISHDFAFHLGGAERVSSSIGQALPTSEFLYIAGEETVIQRMQMEGRGRRIGPGFVTAQNYRQLAPLYPHHLRKLDPLPTNLIASSYGFAHMIPVRGRKVVYCHSPLRQAYSGVDEYRRSLGPLKGNAWKYVAAPVIRSADRKAALGVDLFIATSKAVQARISQYYGRQSSIIPPPVDPRFASWSDTADSSKDDYFLWAGRIVEPYKRVEPLIEAFALMPNRILRIAGEGRDRARLEANAPSNVIFEGAQSTESLAALYRGARALIMPSADDFGMVAVEAMSSGTPVIAWRRAGALDTISEHWSGLFFDESEPESIRRAVEQFEKQDWDPDQIRQWAHRFSDESFKRNLMACLRNE